MSRVLLFECSPRRPSDGVVVPVRLAWKSPGPANHLGQQWEPVVESPPQFVSAIGFDGREFGEAPLPQVGELSFALTDRTRNTAGLVWKNAAVVIRSAPWPVGGGNPATGAFTTIWTGAADSITAAGGLARVALVDAGQVLRAPVLTAKFGSTGIAMLDSADAVRDRAADALVPAAWGRPLSVPGSLIDRTNGIWLFSGRPATAVAAFYDGGAAFTLGVARASLAALIANTPAAGAVDYCLNASGCFIARPWSAPTFPFTVDATFGAVRAADIASAIVSARGGPAFTAGTVAAFNTLQGADCGLYLDDDTTIDKALDRIFTGLGAFWRLRSSGTIDLRRVGFATPALTVPAHLRGSPDRKRIIVPTGRRSLGYARNNKVHSEGDIAAIVQFDDVGGANKPDANATRNFARGVYNPATAYAFGDEIVFGGSSYRLIVANSTGNAPPDVTRWQLFADAILGNSNRIRWSTMEVNRGWAVTFNPSSLAFVPVFDTFNGRRFFAAVVTATAAAQVIVIGQAGAPLPQFALTPGERVSVQARISASGVINNWVFSMWIVRQDGTRTQVGMTSGTGPVDANTANQAVFYTVPSTGSPVIGGYVEVIGDTTGAGTLTLTVAHPMVTGAAPDQIVHPAFESGPAADPGADVTANQPVVSRLSSATGQALDGFVLSTGLPPSQIARSGVARDGDVVTFSPALPSPAFIVFLPGGNSGTAGQNLRIVAEGNSASGFTLRAKTQAVTPGSTITDTGATAGTGLEPDLVMNRSNSGTPFDGGFTFTVSVTVGEIAPGEPGTIQVGLFVKQSGVWQQRGIITASDTLTRSAIIYPGTVDFGAGNEFGVDVLSATGSGTALNTFNSVAYTLGTVTETSLTPTGASGIPWLALL